MKRTFVLLAGLLFAVSLAQAALPVAAETAIDTAAVTAAITLKGDIIDNLCASTQKPKDLGNFVKTHTKECALMPNCAASGYSIYADGTLYKFDADSNKKVKNFLKRADSKLQVSVTAKTVGDVLSLVSIENQK